MVLTTCPGYTGGEGTGTAVYHLIPECSNKHDYFLKVSKVSQELKNKILTQYQAIAILSP